MIRYQFTSDCYHFYFHQIYTHFTANNKIKKVIIKKTQVSMDFESDKIIIERTLIRSTKDKDNTGKNSFRIR